MQVCIVYLLGMDKERLVEEVRKFPCLWNVSVKAYRYIKAKENGWKTVSNEVNILNLECTLVSVQDRGKIIHLFQRGNVTPETCLKRRKNLRDQFVRELRRKKKVKS